MYFDFDDRYQDIEPVGSAISRREGVVLSVVVHAGIVLLMVFGPQLLPAELFQQREEQQLAQAEPPEEQPRFVFVQPRVELETPKPPPRAEASDRDRAQRSPEIVERPSNPLPFARGNSSERVEAAPDERAMGRGPAPEPAPPAPPPAPSGIESTPLPDGGQLAAQREAERLAQQQQVRPPGGQLGDALRNLQRYVQKESFNNPQGGGTEFGPLQFDTKGVEFGPWIRRFIAQIRRNWFVPMAAMTMRGHVVLQFNVHKDGRITDITVAKPSAIESFNTAAYNALAASSPTTPLPPEYPDEKAFFTVTFYYNESPDNAQR
jgi:TonB family protein